MNKTKELPRIILFEKTWILILFLAIILRIVILFLLPVGQSPDEVFIFKRVWGEVLNATNPSLNLDNSRFYPNNEYYYPPLYFLIAGFIIRSFDAIPSVFDQAFVHFYIYLRILSIALSIASLFIIWKILEKFELNNHIRLAIFSFISLLPSFASFSVSVNHNNLLFFLLFLFIYLSIGTKWEPTDYKQAVILGLNFGLALFTKIDAIILLPAFLAYTVFFKKKKAIFKFIIIFLFLY